jgi:hypothetical protein
MGSIKVANDFGEKLTNFYSVDKWKSTDHIKCTKKFTKQHIDPLRSSNKIPESLQEKLWSLPHCASKNNPGQLYLCIRMHVMIKLDQASK